MTRAVVIVRRVEILLWVERRKKDDIDHQRVENIIVGLAKSSGDLPQLPPTPNVVSLPNPPNRISMLWFNFTQGNPSFFPSDFFGWGKKPACQRITILENLIGIFSFPS